MALLGILGILYRDGKDVQKDSSIAYKWFTIAAAARREGNRKYICAPT